MAQYRVNDTSLTAVANAIREKTGATEELAFPEGFVNAMPVVHEAGQKAEYDRFWDAYLHNTAGGTNCGEYAFSGNRWNADTFRPNKDVVPGVASQLFFWHNRNGTPYDLQAHLDSLGVKLDLSKSTYFSDTFQYAGITRVGVLDTRSAASVGSLLTWCTHLVTVDKLILKDDGSQTFTGNNGTTKLENIVVEGVVGQSWNVSQSTKLTHDSLMSIINALKNYAGTGTTKTLTLGTTNLAKLTDAEKAIATQRGWTLA